MRFLSSFTRSFNHFLQHLIDAFSFDDCGTHQTFALSPYVPSAPLVCNGTTFSNSLPLKTGSRNCVVVPPINWWFDRHFNGLLGREKKSPLALVYLPIFFFFLFIYDRNIYWVVSENLNCSATANDVHTKRQWCEPIEGSMETTGNRLRRNFAEEIFIFLGL